MAGLSLPPDAFRLGNLTVVPSLNRIVREGFEVDLEPRVMRVLAVLAQTPGEVVTRLTLFESVWADTVVNDEALTRAVSELRKILADGAPGAVETIRGTGYRLARPVRRVRELDPPGAAPADVAPLVATPTVARQGVEHAGAPVRSERVLPLVGLALGLATVALGVALWAAWPRPTADGRVVDDVPADAFRLGPESQYYRPGMSEFGVYYDSTRGTYFELVPDTE